MSSSLPSYETLLIEVRDRVCWITLNRPERKNAFNTTMYNELLAALYWCAKAKEVHVVVLTGSPNSKPAPYYSSGNDLTNFTQPGSFAPPKEDGSIDIPAVARASAELVTRFVNAFIRFPKVLICCINGPVIGIACTAALIADFVYASDNATFSTPFTKLGQNPEGCSSVLFPARMGAKANRMLLLGETLTAKEADQLNMITGVFPYDQLLKEVHSRAVQLARFPQHSVMRSKQLIRRQIQSTLEAANKDECQVLETNLSDPRTIQAVMKVMQNIGGGKKSKGNNIQSKL